MKRRSDPSRCHRNHQAFSAAELHLVVLVILSLLFSPTTNTLANGQQIDDQCRITPVNGPVDDDGFLDMTDIFTFCAFNSREQECCNVATFEDDTVSKVACSRWNASVSHTICKGSCRGRNACVGWGGTTNEGGVHVGERSCVGVSACAELKNPTRIDGFACIGGSSCRGIGEHQPGNYNVTIKERACEDDFSCAHMGAPVTISNNACVGNSACSFMGEHLAVTGAADSSMMSENNIYVGHDACVGLKSCEQVGLYGNEITINDGACNGISACRAAMNATSSSDGSVITRTVTFGNNSCSGGSNICRNIAAGNSLVSTVNIQDDACNNDYKCENLGSSSSTPSGGIDGGQQCNKNDVTCPDTCGIEVDVVELFAGCSYGCDGSSCTDLPIFTSTPINPGPDGSGTDNSGSGRGGGGVTLFSTVNKLLLMLMIAIGYFV